MQENSKDTLDAKISELEEKLIYNEKQYERAKDLIRSEKVNFQDNPKRWQDNLDFMQKERQDIENQLVALLMAHPDKVEPSTPEGEEQLSFDIFASVGDEESRIRQKIPARLKARQEREAGILEGVLGEARQVLGDDEALGQIALAVQADDSYSDQAGNALLELRRLGDKRVLEPLVGLLKVKGAPGYWSAMALARLFTLEEVLPVLSGRLDATDPVVRLNTVVAFGYLGKTFRFPDPKTAFEFNGFVVSGEPIDDRIFNLLMPMLDDHDDDVRAKTVVELCSLGDKRATPKLVLALEDPAPTVRQCAAAFLGGLGDERAIEPLLRAARSGDKEVESRAGQSLGLLGYEGEGIENPWKRLAEAMGDITAGLAMAFGSADELEKAEDEAGIEGSLGYHLKRAREKMAPEGVEGLITKLKDPISSNRSDAATRLGLLHNRLAVGPLVETLNDPDIQVRNQVISALGQIGDEAAVEPLLALLSIDKDPYRRSLAVNALGKLRTAAERIIPAMVPLVNDPIEEIRLAAIQALSLLGKGSEQIFDVVIEQLSDPNESIAFCAITGLGNLGNPRGLEPLLQELRSESFERRMAAADALGELGDARAIPALEWSRDNDPYHDEDGYCVHNTAGRAIKRILKVEDNDESIG